MTEARPIVVFDFDLTLTRWDTADRFFRWLLKRDAWRLAVIALAFPVLGPLMLFASTRRWPVWFAVWLATWGRDHDAMVVLVDEHIRSLPEGHASVILPPGVQRLREHLAQGHRVVIATGCLDPLARALLAQAGLGEVPLVASTMRPFLGGLVRDEHCFGPNKVPMLTARGFAPPWAVAYTDHHADLPVLERSAERFLIDPRPACLARIEHALPAATKQLSWR